MSDKEVEITNASCVTKVKDEPMSDDDVICDTPFVKKDTYVTVKSEPEDDSDKMKLTVKISDDKVVIEIKKDATTKEV